MGSKSQNNGKVGAVLVVGGGIGGIQAALDLADSGFKVYLLEKGPSIGGVMAQLDKTFPTNDCSMCILAPKLVNAARHPNIELITYADLEEISGDAGNFGVKIKKKSPFVDWEKCNGCGECDLVCPIETANLFECNLVSRKAIYRPFPQAVPNKFAISKLGHAPCRTACPAGVNVQGYVALIRAGKYEEALDLERQANPFASVCGRVCNHPCETECVRGEVDAPIAIASLKRYIAEAGSYPMASQKPTGDKIAVVGAGPGGLSCAYFLARRNYQVIVYETENVIGGMLVLGIPEFRLPRRAIKADIDYIKSYGVEIKTGVKIGETIRIEQLLKDYRAVFLATGAYEEIKLNIEGEELDGVLHCIDFLKRLNLGARITLGENVAVIGGGNAAIDAARVARRLRSKVTILYRRSRMEMPANAWEVDEAEKEGIKIEFLVAPVKIYGTNQVQEIECIRMKLGDPDASGRRRPVPIPGSEFKIRIDNVIVAISQKPQIDWLSKEFERTKDGTLVVNKETLETTVKGVYAGGDLVTGPQTVIKAVAAGKQAAEIIDAHLRGTKIEHKEWKKVRLEPVELKDKPKSQRATMPKLEVDKRTGFDEVELGYDEETARKEAERCIACAICCECSECVKVCQPKAISHSIETRIVDLKVGAIVLAPGYETFDPRLKSMYGYGRYANVIKSIELERILNASGPFQGQLLRPTDHKEPEKIAFIQCVGSRDSKLGNPYCSSVCCVYAVKEAILIKEHSRNVDCTIFCIDIRTFGKGFEAYYERAKKEYGIKFKRALIGDIFESQDTKNLTVRYEDESGELAKEEFNLLVLSVGLKPRNDIKKLSEICKVDLDERNFIRTVPFSMVESARAGIFVCGTASSPKDIPETVTEASAAAGKAIELLQEQRNSLTKKHEYPAELDVSGQKPRIGAFICHCGINIAGTVNVKEVVEYTKTLTDVVYAEDNLYSCSDDTQQHIKEMIGKHNLNRIVIAACTPRTHEPLFQETVREKGLNRYLLEFANIRDQCSWVHSLEPEEATEKAKDLLRMACARSILLEPLPDISIPVTQKGLVIGGGVSGLNASLTLANQGYEVFLVEREKELGGNAKNLFRIIDGRRVKDYLDSLVLRINSHPNIHLYTESTIQEISGYIGNFKAKIRTRNTLSEIEHGVVIVATGAKEYAPTEYMYGKDKRIVTQRELEEKLFNHLSASGGIQPFNYQNVVMIQCVGSRDNERRYCSRICCNKAIKNALIIKEKKPDTEVIVIYKDIRTYGFNEIYYQKARDLGVVFVRYDDESKPEVKQNGTNLYVKVKELILNEEIVLPADLVVLSAGIVPDRTNKETAQLLKVPLNEDGFFLEAHMKLRPVDFATDGIFVCGLAHSSKTLDESIAQAVAAANRAGIVLAKDYIDVVPAVGYVDENKCIGCGICEKMCPYQAHTAKKTEKGFRSEVIPASCKGCGSCAASCPQQAIIMKHFTNEQISAQINALAG